MANRVPTYELFEIHTIMPAPGWQCVYHDEAGAHIHWALAALALVTRRTFVCQTGEECEDTLAPQECTREVVGLDYHPDDGFDVCDIVRNFCGLMEPGMTLEAYERARACDRQPRPIPNAPHAEESR